MKIGLFQDPKRWPGKFLVMPVGTDRRVLFETPKGFRILANMFGYQGPETDQEVMEWLSEKATVILPPEAELTIEDPGVFT